MKFRAMIATSSVILPVLAALAVVMTSGTARAGGTIATELSARGAETELVPPVDDQEDIGGGVSQPPKYETPFIDCSTNIAYRAGVYADHARVLAHNVCSACHKSDSPQMGRNDRPQYRFGSFSLENKYTTTVSYELKVGAEGTWKEYTIEPGRSQRFAWEFKGGAAKSPKYYVKYEGKEYRVQPYATPNVNIGSLYYFGAKVNGADGARILSCKQQPTRRPRW